MDGKNKGRSYYPEVFREIVAYFLEDFREIVAYFPEEGMGEYEGGFKMGLGATIEKSPRHFLQRYLPPTFSCSRSAVIACDAE